MNRRVFTLLGVCLTFSVVIIVNRIVRSWVRYQNDQARFRNYQAMRETEQRMQLVGLALLQYSADYDGKLPPMRNQVVFQRALSPYAMMHEGSFKSTAGGKLFIPNATLANKNLHSVSKNTALFYDAEPLAGYNDVKQQLRVVGYLNYVKAMPESQWLREKAALGIR